ncbi:MAG: DUF2974 domain-containing protein [Eubacteriales bacterium]|nr:DUF2974 domain-containing protein [Eubacteriales bacterium]
MLNLFKKNNILDYIKNNNKTFEEANLNEVDSLIFATMMYTDFTGFISDKIDKYKFLMQGIDKLLKIPNEEFKKRTYYLEDREFHKLMMNSERFKFLNVSNFISIHDKEKDLQFASILIQIKKNEYQIAFEGTDYSVIGWRDTFDLGYRTSASQKYAANYLNNVLKYLEGKHNKDFSCTLSGHSKGGNLAIYSATKVLSEYKKYIKTIYNFDGPGFEKAFLDENDYKEIEEKIVTIVPKGTFVAELLWHSGTFKVVDNKGIGLLQHVPYNFLLKDNNFLYMDKITWNDPLCDKGMKEWLNSLSYDEKKEFVDTIFKWMKDANIDNLREVIDPKTFTKLLQTIKNDSKEDKKFVANTLKLLFEKTFNALIENK